MRSLRAALIYGVLTIVLTWPMSLNLSKMDPGDSAFFAWEMAWEMHALGTDPAQLPHANIFHPLRYALGMDEPILATTLLGLPLRLFTNDAVWIFNVVRLLTFVLSALAAYALARDIGTPETASLFAGALFAFSPIRTDQIAHLSTLGSQWLPLVPLFLFRFLRSARWRDALLAAAAFVLATYSCGYHALLGAAILPIAVVPWLPSFRRRAVPALVAVAATAVAVMPLYWLYKAALAPLGYVRSVAETREFSAGIETFLAASPLNRVYGEISSPFRDRAVNNLFPGLIPLLLIAAAAVAAARARRAPTRESVALSLVVVVAAALALGPVVMWRDQPICAGPFGLLRELVPVFRMIRVPARAGVFMALGLALLAARALGRLRLRPPAAALVSVLALAETVIAPIPSPRWIQAIDSREAVPPVYRWLAAQPGDFAIAELPMVDHGLAFVRPAHHDSIYMVRSTHHWKRLLNGYAGLEPPQYVQLQEKAKRFPSDEALDAFLERGARYVVVHSRGFGPNHTARIRRMLPAVEQARLRRVAEFENDVVFELVAKAVRN